MNRTPDVQLVLREWFADDGSVAPDRILDVVADRIASQPQRRASRLHWRPSVNRYLNVAGLAAVIAVLVFAYNLLPRQPSSGGPSPAPSATAPSPTAPADTPSAPLTRFCEPLFRCDPLPAGTYQSAEFRPTLTFTVPRGWIAVDRAGAFTLSGSSPRFAGLDVEVAVLSQLAIPVEDDCSGDRNPGAGNTVQDWVAFLSEHPGLETTEPMPFALGGFGGMQLDVKVAASWTLRCPESEGPAVVLIADTDPIDTARVRFRILDVAGETVIVYVDESDSSIGSLDTRDAALKPLIETFQFTP